jgi:hypothetical protein
LRSGSQWSFLFAMVVEAEPMSFDACQRSFTLFRQARQGYVCG